MVTLNTTLEKLNFSKNDIIVEFCTDLDTPCEKASLSFQFINNVVGQSIFLTINGVNFTINIEDIGNNEPEILNYFNNHPVFGEYFTVTNLNFVNNGTSTIEFEACECGFIDYEVSNIQGVQSQGGADTMLPEDFTYNANIQCYNTETGKWESLFNNNVLLKAQETNGCTTWVIDKFIDQCLSCQTPNFDNTSTLVNNTDALKEFRYLVYETYTNTDGEPVQTEPVISDTFWVQKGGVNTKQFTPETFLQRNTLTGNTITDNNFIILDHLTDPHKITSAQPVWLPVLFCNTSKTAITIQGQIRYANSNNSTLFTAQTPLLNITVNQVYNLSLPIGLCQNNITANHADVDIVEAYFIITYQGSPQHNISLRIYNVCCHDACDNYFVFCNSLGGTQSVSLPGQNKITHKTQSKIASTFNADKKQYNKTLNQSFELKTPYLNIDNFAPKINEIIFSNNAYLLQYNTQNGCNCYDCDNAIICPVIFNNQTIITRNNKKYETKYTIKYQAQNASIAPTV